MAPGLSVPEAKHVSPVGGSLYELDAIVAVVIGGRRG